MGMELNEIIRQWDPLISVISAFGVIIAIGISGIAIIITNKTSRRQTHDTAYKDVDEQIVDFLKMAVERPELRDPTKTKKFMDAFKGDDEIRYEAYANICWNVCESVFDKILINKKMRDTWEPVIIAENRRHREWLKKSKDGFKDEFLVYMRIKRPETPKEMKICRLDIDDDFVD